MNTKNIKRHLNKKLSDWIRSIDNEEVRKAVVENTIITGGALVSLLIGEQVNDYDVYFRTKESCIAIAGYYVKKWNEKHSDRPVTLNVDEETGKVSCFIRSEGVADENENQQNGVAYDFDSMPEEDEAVGVERESVEPEVPEGDSQEKYRPRFITSNAITLSHKIQIVTRFYGEVEDIHKNYDFAHCTCAWSSWDNNVLLPLKALECIINKELYYVGSQYPLCSIIRTRKYLERGYYINAGQYVKMAMQLNELDLKNIQILEDQLTGVDTTYFTLMIKALQERAEETGEQKVDRSYVFELINKLF